jgi:hypothetical protein
MEHIKKTYYGGYKPKSNNVVKLEAYVKNTGRGDLKNELPKGNTSITNKVLKNKRIR